MIEAVTQWFEGARAWLEERELLEWVSQLMERWAPVAARFVLVLIAGHLLSWALVRAMRWLGGRLELDHRARRAGVDFLGDRSPTELLARGTRALVALGTVYVAATVAGIEPLTNLARAALAFTPTLLTALAILGVGVFGAGWARATTRSLLSGRPGTQVLAQTVPTLVYGAILSVTAVSAADQLGVDVGLVESLLLVTVAGGVMALALALALGGGRILGHLLARHHVHRAYAVDDELTIDGVTGRLLHIGPTASMFEVESGRRVVPHRALLEARVLRSRAPGASRVGEEE